MPLYSVKTIFFALTLLLLLLQLFKGKIKSEKNLHFLLSSMIITTLLLSIITLKLHHMFRSQFNIPNTVTYVVSAVPFIYYFFRFKKIIFDTQYYILVISALLIGLASLLDLFTDGNIISFSSSDFIEEILRILGAFFGFLYYCIYVYSSNKKIT